MSFCFSSTKIAEQESIIGPAWEVDTSRWGERWKKGLGG
jgi:hypothetical protein